MADAPAPASAFAGVTQAITLVSLALGAFATWRALPLDDEIKRLQAETTRLDLALKQADAELKNLEAGRRITLELYAEVKKVIEKKDREPREEEVMRVLIESLADDPFRWKLLQVLAVGAQAPEVKQAAAATSRFYEEEAGVKAPPPAAPPAPATAAGGVGVGAYNVDIFYCEARRATAEPLAKAALALRGPTDTGRWRLRALPESINQQPGYGVAVSEIRYTPPDERPAAEALAQALRGRGIDPKYRETAYPTPNYVSVFVCQ